MNKHEQYKITYRTRNNSQSEIVWTAKSDLKKLRQHDRSST